ncbi:Histidine kinase-, DNA gyrase B-, and HSP90-like ATPase [Lampropedia hyalina DSM 16112]|uniref:histidine kinase n=2 Tax=Lampropedia TaxID=198705 RepID=A0A1M4THG7_9BURK|nr:Histidine kinase-, DNA gyrase B-, and HSP90-like ATPase [Lampropedia hyalina DSM 16112]
MDSFFEKYKVSGQWGELQIAGLLRSLVNELIEEGGLATLDMPDDVMLPLRMNAFKRAIRNIAQNAIRYGGEANIRVVRREEHVLILIEDHGPGIAEADRDRVFEPFVRLEPSRNRDTGGNGLGLAIAKAVIESHGGDISIGMGAHGGALITITMTRCY